MRPSWDEYFLKIAAEIAGMSTCLRRQVGALIVRDKQILTTGFNGAPTGEAHCETPAWNRGYVTTDTTCQRLDVPSGARLDLCRGVHAEMNAIIQGALHGVSIDGGTLYCTNTPCPLCAKMLKNAGIVRIVAAEEYPGGEEKDEGNDAS